MQCAAGATAVDIQEVLPLLKLMSEPNRLKIFSLLCAGERCVCDIETGMQLPQNLISHHLGVLRDAGYIRARRDGRWVYYSVNKETLAAIYPTLCRLFNPECVTDACFSDSQACQVKEI
jgi:ArsR family transcriptional regulator, arsenate/arsenite/antimonite-responsive transcriptional repressor